MINNGLNYIYSVLLVLGTDWMLQNRKRLPQEVMSLFLSGSEECIQAHDVHYILQKITPLQGLS